MAPRGYEHRLLLVFFSDSDEMVGIPEVQLCEDCGSLETLKGCVHQWQGILVLHSYFIQPPVINELSFFCFFLFLFIMFFVHEK